MGNMRRGWWAMMELIIFLRDKQLGNLHESWPTAVEDNGMMMEQEIVKMKENHLQQFGDEK